jgi:hypothetical protein
MSVSVGSLTQYGETLALNALATGVPFNIPNLWLALYTTAPTDTSAGTEVGGTGAYTRLPIFFLGASGAPATTSNSNDVYFPGGTPPGTGTATSNWGIVRAFAICDSISLGNQIWWGNLATPRTINSGDALDFPVGSIQLMMD